ncbi:MAG: hypothetical protein RO009_03740 [Pseudorhodoplanes sp.]|jgi:hypothetical protein|nr:hypothetical protein [Pseudorhodoplanes sp.]
MLPAWLPELILLTDHNGDWEQYLEAVYAVFHNDFVGANLEYQGRRLGLKRHPVENGKEATFWHFISSGKSESDRLVDLRRCERIGWPRAILDNCTDPCLKVWEEQKNSETRIHIWCEPAEYLVVLADRESFLLPWTAFDVPQAHYQRKLQGRWEANNEPTNG